MTHRGTHEHENNKLFSYQKQAKSEDEENELEQKQDPHQDARLTASSVNYLYVVGGFALAAGATLLSTWLTYLVPPGELGPPAIHLLSSSAFILIAFGVSIIAIPYIKSHQKKKNLF